MADTVTTNFGWIKPEVGASSTTWGDKTNGNWDAVDALVFSMKGITDVANTPARIHAATNKATPVDADEIPGLDSAASFGLVKFTWSQIKAYVLAYFNATAKNPPVDADRVWFGDSAASNIPKYATWTQIKAYLKSYFDTLYEPSFATIAWGLITGTPTTVAGYGITNVIFTKSFESARQSYTAGGSITVAHGLGVAPKLYQVYFQCITAEFGYAVNDEILMFSLHQSGNYGIEMRADGTNLKLTIGTGGVGVLDTGGTGQTLTPSKWGVVVRAWA